MYNRWLEAMEMQEPRGNVLYLIIIMQICQPDTSVKLSKLTNNSLFASPLDLTYSITFPCGCHFDTKPAVRCAPLPSMMYP